MSRGCMKSPSKSRVAFVSVVLSFFWRKKTVNIAMLHITPLTYLGRHSDENGEWLTVGPATNYRATPKVGRVSQAVMGKQSNEAHVTYSGFRKKCFRDHLAIASRDVIDHIEELYENSFNQGYDEMYSRSIDQYFCTVWEQLYVALINCTLDMDVFKNTCEDAFSNAYNTMCDAYTYPEDWTYLQRIVHTTCCSMKHVEDTVVSSYTSSYT